MTKSEIAHAIRQSSMLPQEALDQIRDNVIRVVKNNVIGDMVECGVWMGGSAATMAKTLLELGEDRIIRLFDSFDDICEPTAIDGARFIKQVGGMYNAQGRLQPVKGFYKKRGLSGPGNRKHVFDLLTKVVGYREDRVKIYKGWFQKTIKQYSERIDNIAILVLDCDLYVSIKLCLDYLYDKVVSGGIIMIDDYHYYDGCTKAVDEFVKARNIVFEDTNLSCWTKK